MKRMLLKKFSLTNNSTFRNTGLKLVALMLGLSCFSEVDAQKLKRTEKAKIRCGTMEAIMNDPEQRARMEQNERDYQLMLSNGQFNARPSSPTVLTDTVVIPVVVHIVLPNPWQVTDEAVEYFIHRLNLDFSGLNPDSTNAGSFMSRRGHSLLRFRLARRDPNGNFTTGIVRKVGTTIIAQANNQPIKNSNTATGGSTGWNISQYYNMYVGDGGVAGLLGISPGIGPGNSVPGSPNQDGVCVDYRAFGPNCYSFEEYKMSRTAIHEVGHNFGLYHIWGDNTACNDQDFRQLSTAFCSLPASLLSAAGIDDTPKQSGPTSGCPQGAISNGCTPAEPRMYQNYMDYSDDACYSMFTNGQAKRMEWLLENCRSGYLTTLGGEYPASVPALDAAFNSVVSPGGNDWSETTCSGVTYPVQTCPGSFVPRIRVSNFGATAITSVTITTTINGLNPQTQTIAVNIPSFKTRIVTLDPQVAVPGANDLKFVLSAPNGGTDGNATNDEFTYRFTVASSLAIPYVENFQATTFPPANGSGVVNPDGDVTWERTTAAARPGPGAMTINLYNYAEIGERDIYRTPPVNVNLYDSLTISFYVAHQQYEDGSTPPTNDSLRVVYSPDCGATWFPTSYAKGGATLSTVAGTTDADFVPTNAQWRKETIVLTDFCQSGLSNIMIGFESYCDFGNNIYIDSIHIRGVAAVANNAVLDAIVEPAAALCTTNFTPRVTIRNAGVDTMTSLTIKYSLDNSTNFSTVNWTGSLGKCQTTTVALPAATTTIGTHVITVFTENPNGTADLVPNNDTLTRVFSVFTSAATPLVEDFETNVFPSTNWGVVNVNGGTTWERSTSGSRTGTGALLMNNPNVINNNNAVDYFISPIVINSESFDSVFVDFDLAYKAGRQYPGSTVFPLDTLEVLATTDCGATFTSVWKKWGDALQTVNDPNYTNTNAFVPVRSQEWSANRIDLKSVVGSANFQLYFVAKGNKQNNIWLDNINISALTLPQRLKDQGYLVYPNPFNNTFLIHHSAVEPPVDLQAAQVFNSSGQMVWSREYKGNANRQITVDLGKNTSGLYILKMIYTNKTVVERIIKN